jgi:hypothetical protein
VTRVPAALPLLLALASSASLTGCATSGPREGAGPRGPSSADEQEAERAYEQLLRAHADLHAARAQAQPPGAAADCARIGQLRDNICALAGRICEIADREPPGSTAAEHCADGKTRCKDAIDAARTRGCPTKNGLPAPSPSR